MKFLKSFLLGSTFTVACLFSLATLHHRPIKPRTFNNSPQRAATHEMRLYSLNVKGQPDEDGSCTATAIGPHALLTASHCNEFGEDKFIQLDYSSRYFHILAIATDNRDHDIYILDGPAFTHYVTVHAREARIGESVTSYGTGGNDFPPHAYYGKVVMDFNGGDTSDVDIAERTHAFSFRAIPGDSGSAVYATDGSIVGLVTWGNGDASEGPEAVGMALNFPAKVYENIRNVKETQNNGDDTSPTADSDSAGNNGATGSH